MLLVSSRLDCPGMSVTEVCATCMEVSMWSFNGQYDFECLLLPISKNKNKF